MDVSRRASGVMDIDRCPTPPSTHINNVPHQCCSQCNTSSFLDYLVIFPSPPSLSFSPLVFVTSSSRRQSGGGMSVDICDIYDELIGSGSNSPIGGRSSSNHGTNTTTATTTNNSSSSNSMFHPRQHHHTNNEEQEEVQMRELSEFPPSALVAAAHVRG